MVSTPELTALVTVQVPESANASYPDAAVRAALASLAVRPPVPIEEQLSLLPFKVGDLAGFRIGGMMPGRAVMLSDAAADARSSAEPHIVVAIAPGGPRKPATAKPSRAKFRHHPQHQGHPRHECRAAADRRSAWPPDHGQCHRTVNGADVTVVQWLRFGGGGYMHLVGVARTDAWAQAYPRFRAVRDGMVPKCDPQRLGSATRTGMQRRWQAHLQNSFDAMRAPSAIAAILAQTTSGSTAAWPTQVPKPQSDAGDHVLAPDQLGVARDALRDQFGMLDEVRFRIRSRRE